MHARLVPTRPRGIYRRPRAAKSQSNCIPRARLGRANAAPVSPRPDARTACGGGGKARGLMQAGRCNSKLGAEMSQRLRQNHLHGIEWRPMRRKNQPAAPRPAGLTAGGSGGRLAELPRKARRNARPRVRLNSPETFLVKILLKRRIHDSALSGTSLQTAGRRARNLTGQQYQWVTFLVQL